MNLSRLTVLSVVYNLKDFLHNRGLTTDPSISGFYYIKVQTKDQAYEDMHVPGIVIYISGVNDAELQIGGGYWVNTTIHFDIYGENDSQMLEMCDFVREFIESPTYILRYDQSYPTYQVSDGFVRPTYSSGPPTSVAQVFFESRTTNVFGRIDIEGEATAHTAQVTAVVQFPTS